MSKNLVLGWAIWFGLLILVVGGFAYAVLHPRVNEFRERCVNELHGNYEIVTHRNSSTKYCLSDDGRILEIK